jgi:hypothetical protein
MKIPQHSWAWQTAKRSCSTIAQGQVIIIIIIIIIITMMMMVSFTGHQTQPQWLWRLRPTDILFCKQSQQRSVVLMASWLWVVCRYSQGASSSPGARELPTIQGRAAVPS